MKRVAVVSPDVSIPGGVRSSVSFVMQTITQHSGYEPLLVSLSTASDDRASTRLLAPGSWRAGPGLLPELSPEGDYVHVGAALTELEWMRYRSRRALTTLLQSADLVHVVAGTPAWGLVAAQVRAPVILHVATLTEWERGAPQGNAAVARWRRSMTRLTSALDRKALSSATRVLAMNGRLAAFAETYAPGRVGVLHPGTSSASFYPPAQYAVGGHLLSVGRLVEPRKDWPSLFRAYREALQATPSLPDLVIAGRGDLSTEDAALLRELGIGERCRIVRDPSPAELLALYQEASLYVLSSREEGFGLVVVEAMMCGVPVVATRLDGTVETVAHGSTGVLVPRGAALVDELAREIADLWGDAPRRRAMSERAAQEAHRFSTETLGRRLLDVYDCVLDA